MDIFQFDDYKKFLLALFQQKALNNPNFSMRAWAKSLEIDHTLLHKILKGERKVPKELRKTLPFKLDLEDKAANYFTLLVEHSEKSNEHIKELIRKEMGLLKSRAEYKDLSFKQFESLDFFDIVISEMVDLSSFPFSPTTIAEKLKINPEIIVSKIKKLTDLRIIEKKDGKFVKVDKKLRYKINFSQESLHEFFKEMNYQASVNVDYGDPKRRVFRTRIVSISKENGPMFAKMVDRFLAELEEAFKDNNPKTDIGCINLQFFRLWDNHQTVKK